MSQNTSEESRRHQLAVFPSRRAAERAFHALVKAGFEGRGISLFVQAPVKGGIPATGSSTVPDAIEVGGAAGAELGGAVGGIGGLLAGLGLLAIPGVGPMLAVGPLAAALTGAIAGGAVGGFAGSLAGLGISEAEAIAAERHMKAGLAVVIVVCGGRCEEAREIMRKTGAIKSGGLPLSPNPDNGAE